MATTRIQYVNLVGIDADPTDPQVANLATIQQRAQAALQANTTFLSLPDPTPANQTFLGLQSPTNAQVLTQVKALTQQMNAIIAQAQTLTKENNAIIRILLGLFDDTTGT